MKTHIISLVILSCLLLSCNKRNYNGVPECIKKQIRHEKKGCLDGVYEYSYQGKKVYYFSSGAVCGSYSDTYMWLDDECYFFYKDSSDILTDEKLIWERYYKK